MDVQNGPTLYDSTVYVLFGVLESRFRTLLLEGPVHVCILTGVPKSSIKTLDAMSDIITKFSGHALYQVYAIPARPTIPLNVILTSNLGGIPTTLPSMARSCCFMKFWKI